MSLNAAIDFLYFMCKFLYAQLFSVHVLVILTATINNEVNHVLQKSTLKPISTVKYRNCAQLLFLYRKLKSPKRFISALEISKEKEEKIHSLKKKY